jgi:hypothetical protein
MPSAWMEERWMKPARSRPPNHRSLLVADDVGDVVWRVAAG